MKITPEITEKLKRLEEKYEGDGQDLASHLEGLIHSDYVNYWNYIELDTLLSLQRPRTQFPDEEIFILYHQITELYFKLSINELERIGEEEIIDYNFFYTRVKRVSRYFDMLVSSFEVMVEGMDPKEFMQFRMSLAPASGFQSAQYRKIELMCTDIHHLVSFEKRHALKGEMDIERLYANLYWKQGALDSKTGEKSLTLRQFEKKYDHELLSVAQRSTKINIWSAYNRLAPRDQNRQELISEMRNLDANVNINWPLAHYKSAVRYLRQKNADVAATGGTNWQKYLPPRFQKRIFFPDLWSNQEQVYWGKTWVEDNVYSQ